MMEKRPNPEALLERVQEAERQKVRGKLKIYLGAAPGVGKTYTMLQDALAQRHQGLDIVVGVVESHGRQKIESLLKHFDILPRQVVDYRDKQLLEFDLDNALKRNPGLILIDEMAHTNAPGLRHTKRWQDIKEILDRGIDVYTTLNVQHIESFNDIVSQIIQTRIKETVPDTLLESADIIELVDLPPEDLLKRLEEGKVYIPHQVKQAKENFFRKGNLIALRELALRATAERVKAQALLYREGEGTKHIRPIKEKILVCVGHGNETIKLIRAARRMAAKLQVEWIAVHVDSSSLRTSEEQRNSVIQNLRFAEQLGAQTRILTGFDIVKEIMNFAHEQNITLVIVWKQIRPRWKDFLIRSIADEIVRHSGEIDVYIVTPSPSDDIEVIQPKKSRPSSPLIIWRNYAIALGVVILTTLTDFILYPLLERDNLVMVYLLGIPIVALLGQMGPSILATVLSALAYNFFFIPPAMDFKLYNIQYIFNFFVMLLVAYVISHLTIRIRRQTEVAKRTEQHTAALHTLSQHLASARGIDKLIEIAVQYIGEIFESEASVLIPRNNHLQVRGRYRTKQSLNVKEQGVAQWVYDLGQLAGLGTDTLPFSDALYLPLLAPHGTLGVLRIQPILLQRLFTSEEIDLLESCASQLALTLEADRIEEHAKKSEIRSKTDHVRSSLLQAVSHNLRTPLIAAMGSASTLVEMSSELDKHMIKKLGQDIHVELDQLDRLINNLLQITYLEAEKIKLNKEPHAIEEAIALAIRQSHDKIGKKPIKLDLANDLPLVPFDKTLMHEVFMNLIDNAIKFTPPESVIEISAVVESHTIIVKVSDQGPGILPDEADKLFAKFYRGRLLTTERGLGLGLAICHSIILAHGGKIWAENRKEGGAAFCFTLPLH